MRFIEKVESGDRKPAMARTSTYGKFALRLQPIILAQLPESADRLPVMGRFV
jgi:hypothetical protein